MIAHWQQIVFYCFCLITLTQLFYYLYFFVHLAYYKAKPAARSQTHAVSVIICARDEAANLIKNLPPVLIQKYATTHEVLVVDDNSYDESRFVLEDLRKPYKHLQVVSLKQEASFITGKKYPLSMGIKSAKHEVLLLTDADCIPATEFWLEKMQEGYRDGIEIVLGYGAYHKKKGVLNKIIRWETFHTALQYLSYAAAGQAYMGVGRNLSYRKSVFFRHKGFSSHQKVASGDDDLFINKAATKKNTAIVVDQDAFTLSEPAHTFRQWMHQKRRHHSTGRYYKTYHTILLGLYSLSHFLFYPLCILCWMFVNWKVTFLIFFMRLVIQGFIFYRAMKKLNETDLFIWFFLFDVGMFFYYLLFSFSLFKKPAKNWK